MRAISADKRVLSCWSVNGQLRYRLVDSEANDVRRVVSVFDHIDTILS
jgi:hypothetical protein